MSAIPVTDAELRAIVLEALLLAVEATTLSRSIAMAANVGRNGSARDGPDMGAPYAPPARRDVAATLQATDPSEEATEAGGVPVWDRVTDQPG